MAQFDVYPNPNPASRARVPYLVALPSDLLGTFDAEGCPAFVPRATRTACFSMPRTLCNPKSKPSSGNKMSREPVDSSEGLLLTVPFAE